jgi:hypothetical protein
MFLSNETKLSKLYEFTKKKSGQAERTSSRSSTMSNNVIPINSLAASQQNICSQSNFAVKILNNLNVNIFHHFGSYKVNHVQEKELPSRSQQCTCSPQTTVN